CTLIPAWSQPKLSFRHINKRNGLSQGSVFAITQDADGFIWLGTRDGLNRYDGYHLKIYRKGEPSSNGLVTSDIRGLYHDPLTKDIWICTSDELSVYHPQTDKFDTYAFPTTGSASASAEVRCVMRDSQQRLWAGTGDGLFIYLAEKDSFLRHENYLVAGTDHEYPDVQVLFEDQLGQLWIGARQGLSYVHVDDQIAAPISPENPTPLESELLHSNIKAILADDEGALWIGTHTKGVFKWEPSTQEVAHFLPNEKVRGSLCHERVRCMGKDIQGRIWVGTFLGLSIYDHKEEVFHTYQQENGNPKSLISSSIRSIFFDSGGGAWVGTYYGGVNYYNSNSLKFENYQPQSNGRSLSHPIISSFLEDDNGNIWIGTEGGGIDYWNRKTDQFSNFVKSDGSSSGLSGNNVKTIKLRNDSMWVGTYSKGLNLYHMGTRRWEHFSISDVPNSGFSGDNVYGLLLDGGDLWIATFGGGLHIMNLSTGERTIYTHDPLDSTSISSDRTRVLLKDKRGNIWLGTNLGLNRFSPASSHGFDRFLPNRRVYSLYESGKGIIWVGSYNDGLFALDQSGNILSHYQEKNGLPGHSIFGILEDKLGRIWVSTDNGIAKLNPKDDQITAFNYSDGLTNLEFNFNAYAKTRTGEMLFGGTEGFTSFNPQDIQVNTFVPPIVFTSLTSFNKAIQVGDASGLLSKSINNTTHLEFPYNKANFSIGFSALDFLNPENNHYAYKLEGLEQDWNYSTGASEVTYTLQKEGTYTLRVQASNNDGIWNPQERQILIQVTPPFWRSTWAYTLYPLLLALAIGGVIWFSRIRHRLQLEKLEKGQQEELHQAKLRFYTNITHEFRTPLTLIMGPTEELLAAHKGNRQLLSIKHNSQRLLGLVDQLLTFRKLETDHGKMEAAKGDILKFIKEIYLSFQEHARIRKITYEFYADEESIELWYDRNKLEIVFYNLLSNAFKFTPDGGKIGVDLQKEEASLIIRIKDSGPGISAEKKDLIFQRFYTEGQKKDFLRSSGIGLTVSKQLVDMHRGEISLMETEEVGTCFEVRLPMGKEHLKDHELINDFQSSENLKAYLKKSPSKAPSSHLPADGQADEKVCIPEKEKRILLLVEDNQEIRQYIKETFASSYKVITAEDGEKGLDAALQHMPDLIISDVMMPKMDGISLCSHLKSRLETSHIPVILLTARTGQIFKVEGLETGADAYITKPFSPYELSLRVNNLLESRDKIRSKFIKVLQIEPKEVTLTSSDEIFLTRAMEVVEVHMDDAFFQVEQFAREMAVSRALLFSKLKGITSQTPNNFVKTLRLKRAAQLLKGSDLGVSEIAFQVGFNDAKYFSKCFQKQFDKTPTSYRQSLASIEQ
ncbi:MAG: two-component regulator propeller domain-containing protein, partial [Bacteroidota bacterium]